MPPRGKKAKPATGTSTPDAKDSAKLVASEGVAINKALSLVPVESKDTAAPAPALTTTTEKSETGADGEPKASLNPYVREIQKRVAKINKKKRQIEQIEAKIKDLTPEEIKTTLLINKDEHTKLSAKTALDAQASEYTDILAAFTTVTTDDEKRISEEKTTSDASITAKIEAARKEGKEEGVAEQKLVLHTLFDFLRLAGYRRQVPDGEENENEAIEKVLVMVYSSKETATEAAELMSSNSDQTVEETTVTYARVKELAASLYDEQDATTAQDAADATVTTDATEHHADHAPTNAQASGLTNGDTVPTAGLVDDGASNAAAVQHTTEDGNTTLPLDSWETIPSAGESWENGGAVAPAASWAEESNEAAQAATPSTETPTEEAFREVSHRHGAQRGRRSDGHGPRGDGFRGGRGRGGGEHRGSFHGDRGGRGGRGDRGGFSGRGDHRGRGEFRGGRGYARGEGFRGRGGGNWNEHREARGGAGNGGAAAAVPAKTEASQADPTPAPVAPAEEK